MSTGKSGYGGTNWIEVFKTGRHVDGSGRELTVTEVDLDHIAATDLDAKPVPLVFGHPRTDGPAYGWVSGLKVLGDKLLAKFQNVPEAVRQIVPQHYRRVSIALRPDLSLRHVGLLGAVAPAVPGLADVKFEEEEGLRVFAGADDPTPSQEDAMGLKDDIAALRALLEDLKKSGGADPAKVAELEAKVAAMEKTVGEELAQAKQAATDAQAQFAEVQAKSRRDGLKGRLEKLCGPDQAKLTPGEIPALLAFAEALDAPGQDGKPRELEFSEGQGKKSLVEHFFNHLESRPGHGLFQEFNGPGKQDAPSTIGLTAKV